MVCELKISSVISCCFNEHQVFSGIKRLLILRVGVQSKYFAKIKFERNISLFQNNNKTKNKA
jgi:hypothetical protein